MSLYLTGFEIAVAIHNVGGQEEFAFCCQDFSHDWKGYLAEHWLNYSKSYNGGVGYLSRWLSSHNRESFIKRALELDKHPHSEVLYGTHWEDVLGM